jgi:hypothetical protein
MGRQFECSAPPAELDVGVVTLSLSQQRGSRHEAEGVAEVAERELAAKLPVSVSLPGGHLAREDSGFFLGKRGSPGPARFAMLSGEIRHFESREREIERERRDLNPRPPA